MLAQLPSRYNFHKRKIKTDTCDRPDNADATIMRFLQSKKRKKLEMYWIKKSLLVQLPPRYFYKQKSKNRYFQPTWHSCCSGIAIFPIKKAITVSGHTGKASDTRRASYFWWKSRYLQPTKPQVYAQASSTYSPWYFGLKTQVPAAVTCCASCFRWVIR